MPEGRLAYFQRHRHERAKPGLSRDYRRPCSQYSYKPPQELRQEAIEAGQPPGMQAEHRDQAPNEVHSKQRRPKRNRLRRRYAWLPHEELRQQRPAAHIYDLDN